MERGGGQRAVGLEGLGRGAEAVREEVQTGAVYGLGLEVGRGCVRGGMGDGEGTVEIIYELHPDKLVVEVADEGEGFEPPADRSSPPEDDDLSECGLPFASIEALSAELEIPQRDECGFSPCFDTHHHLSAS